MNSLFEKGTKGKRLAHGPVDLSSLNHFAPGFQDSVDTTVQFEVRGVRRTGAEPLSDVLKCLLMDSGLADLVILLHHCLGLLLGHRALVDELLAIKLQDV